MNTKVAILNELLPPRIESSRVASSEWAYPVNVSKTPPNTQLVGFLHVDANSSASAQLWCNNQLLVILLSLLTTATMQYGTVSINPARATCRFCTKSSWALWDSVPSMHSCHMRIYCYWYDFDRTRKMKNMEKAFGQNCFCSSQIRSLYRRSCMVWVPTTCCSSRSISANSTLRTATCWHAPVTDTRTLLSSSGMYKSRQRARWCACARCKHFSTTTRPC